MTAEEKSPTEHLGLESSSIVISDYIGMFKSEGYETPSILDEAKSVAELVESLQKSRCYEALKTLCAMSNIGPKKVDDHYEWSEGWREPPSGTDIHKLNSSDTNDWVHRDDRIIYYPIGGLIYAEGTSQDRYHKKVQKELFHIVITPDTIAFADEEDNIVESTPEQFSRLKLSLKQLLVDVEYHIGLGMSGAGSQEREALLRDDWAKL